jgi:hypothetical protein
MLSQSNASRNGHIKPTRNADLRHAQSLGRQRAKAAEVSPQHKAACIHRFIQKAMAEGQPVDLTPHGVIDDATWTELLSIVSPEELTAINGQSEPAPVAAAQPELPGWRDQLAPLTDMFEWTDSDGHAHHLTIRADDLDELLIQLRTVKAYIRAAKARDEKPADTQPKEEQRQAESACNEPTDPTRLWCERHQTWLNRREKNGAVWYSHKTAEGWCRRAAK